MRRSGRRQCSGSLFSSTPTPYALFTFPAELKLQAEALYRTGRAQRLLDLVAEHPEAWRARPNMHLAFRNAPVAQRLYLHCHLETTDYIHRWMGNDFGH